MAAVEVTAKVNARTRPPPAGAYPQERAFRAAVEADPADLTVRLAFADWLDECPDPAGAAGRLLAWTGYAPSEYRHDEVSDREDEWTWFRDDYMYGDADDGGVAWWARVAGNAVLPGDWFDLLEGGVPGLHSRPAALGPGRPGPGRPVGGGPVPGHPAADRRGLRLLGAVGRVQLRDDLDPER